MKLKDVVIGAEYTSRVSGTLKRVRVLRDVATNGYTSRPLHLRKRFDCLVIETGRFIRRTAAALRA